MKDLLSILITSLVVTTAIYFIIRPGEGGGAVVVIEPDMNVRHMPQEYYITTIEEDDMDNLIDDSFIQRYDAGYAQTHGAVELTLK